MPLKKSASKATTTTTTKKTTKKAKRTTAKAAPAAPSLDLTISSAPRAHMEFSVEASGLEPLEAASLTMNHPGGAVEALNVRVNPNGSAYWTLHPMEAGDYRLEVAAGDKKITKTVTVL